MEAITDFHTHILPEIDDGSQSVEQSIQMLRLEAAQGISHVVATPHFYARYDSPERFLTRRAQAVARLQAAMEQEAGLPRLSVGAEVYFFRGMSESDILPQLTIQGKKCILIEMPPAPWTEDIYRELEKIWEKQGIIPVVAHIDRYISPWRTHGIPKRLARMPVFVQANASFFLERGTARMAMKMIKAGQIQLIGSDCHDLSQRSPNLQVALQRIARKLGPEALCKIREFEQKCLDM